MKKDKYPCKYWKRCCDYKRSKELCHDKNWIYCITYKNLIKKEHGTKE